MGQLRSSLGYSRLQLRYPFVLHGLTSACAGREQRRVAKDKHVVVIGGDTDSVTNFEVMPVPLEKENKLLTWPEWPLKLPTPKLSASRSTRAGDVAPLGRMAHCSRAAYRFAPYHEDHLCS